MRKYHQLTIEEREKIAMLRQSKPSLAKIAIATNRSKSTISRELRRNQSPPGEYWPDTPAIIGFGEAGERLQAR